MGVIRGNKNSSARVFYKRKELKHSTPKTKFAKAVKQKNRKKSGATLSRTNPPQSDQISSNTKTLAPLVNTKQKRKRKAQENPEETSKIAPKSKTKKLPPENNAAKNSLPKSLKSKKKKRLAAADSEEIPPAIPMSSEASQHEFEEETENGFEESSSASNESGILKRKEEIFVFLPSKSKLEKGTRSNSNVLMFPVKEKVHTLEKVPILGKSSQYKMNGKEDAVESDLEEYDAIDDSVDFKNVEERHFLSHPLKGKRPKAAPSTSKMKAKEKKATLEKIPMLKSLLLNQVHPASTQVKGFEDFCWILHSFDVATFFADYWEKKPLLIKRKTPLFYSGVFSTVALDSILRKQKVFYTKNLDVTSYRDGKRETHNPDGRALSPIVWDFYNDGCSIRFLNPQTFHQPVWKLLHHLQDFFSSFCGANVYLTPPETQGFAPHWDDIEAFILQLEGKKRWRVYAPRSMEETLPRESSGNFGPEDDLGEPVIDCVLEAGDLLYFPRGFIHQGHTLEDHSLHITISTFQKTAWADFFEKLLPATLASLAEEDVEFRRGLPFGYLNSMGVVYSETPSDIRETFTNKAQELLKKLLEKVALDSAVDQMAKGFVHDALPPCLATEDYEASVYGGGEFWCAEEQTVTNRVELAPDTQIRLITKNCARLVVEEDVIKIFYSVENSREYHAEDLRYMEIESDIAPGFECLACAYPKYVRIEDLPLLNLEEKMGLATSLWEKGIIRTRTVLPEVYDA